MFPKRRLNRIFGKDGRCLIVAMDHVGFMNKPMPGLIDPKKTIRACVANGADTIMTTAGTAKACQNEIGAAGLIVTLSSFEIPLVATAVESVLAVGADAVKALVFPFQHTPEPSMINLVALGAQCNRWGVGLLAETIPGGWTAGPEMRTPEVLAGAGRVAVEAGADFIKTFPIADPTQFAVVAENSMVPVVILGGDKFGSDRELLQSVKAHIDHGAAGVAMGRNLWGHPEPGRLTAGLVAIIHKNASVDEALVAMDKAVSG